jgi:hypothetical protein
MTARSRLHRRTAGLHDNLHIRNNSPVPFCHSFCHVNKHTLVPVWKSIRGNLNSRLSGDNFGALQARCAGPDSLTGRCKPEPNLRSREVPVLRSARSGRSSFCLHSSGPPSRREVILKFGNSEAPQVKLRVRPRPGGWRAIPPKGSNLAFDYMPLPDSFFGGVPAKVLPPGPAGLQRPRQLLLDVIFFLGGGGRGKG